MAAFLQRNPWILPAVFALLLGAVGFASYTSIRESAKQQLAERLLTVRDASVTSLRIWSDEKKAQAQVMAADPVVIEYARALVDLSRRAKDLPSELEAHPAQAALREKLRASVEKHGYLDHGVVTPAGLLVSASHTPLGVRATGLLDLLPAILGGETVITAPLAGDELSEAAGFDSRMIVAAPILDEQGRPLAAFGFAISPSLEFAQILTVARTGESGETYAFDREGRLISPSRFEEQLRGIGLLQPGQGSEMNVQVRDPGGNLTQGHTPELPLQARPFTLAAATAIGGEAAVQVDGFPDYRGVPVVGAWTWVPELGIGITSEIDVDEAYAPIENLRQNFAVVLVLLVLATLGMFLYSFIAVRLRKQMDEARHLGRYRIESRIGKGGMGTVYLARHSLLRRPTAVKVLNPDRSGKEGQARFEREVQTTSALRHPNTIEIYDYGYTPDGTFYYAMEYLQGIDVGRCVEYDGAQSEARVLHVMRQACGSIAEAHAAGLIHRDIKPANIMLCERGGLYDFVKVLDFGLVRQQAQAQDAALTDVASLTGTPLYMPPEAVRTPESLDARGDVYQLGLVAYFLLTGRPPFSADSPMDVMLKHVSQAPKPPSEVLGEEVSPDLERIILECLEKKPDQRPRDAGALLAAFESCRVEGTWSAFEARAWWAIWTEREAVRRANKRQSTSTGTMPTGIELATRTQD